jgi:hypothetical protein
MNLHVLKKKDPAMCRADGVNVAKEAQQMTGKVSFAK